MIKSEYGGTISHLEAKHITTIHVPVLSKHEQIAIHEKIIKAYRLRDEANELLDQADIHLHTLLDVAPFTEADIEYLGKESDPRAFMVSAAELGVRLDATNHVPVARSAIHKLQGGRFQLIPLEERVDRVYVAPRFARVYVEKEFGGIRLRRDS